MSLLRSRDSGAVAGYAWLTAPGAVWDSSHSTVVTVVVIMYQMKLPFIGYLVGKDGEGLVDFEGVAWGVVLPSVDLP